MPWRVSAWLGRVSVWLAVASPALVGAEAPEQGTGAAPPESAAAPAHEPAAAPPAPPRPPIEVRLPDDLEAGFAPRVAPMDRAAPAPGSCLGGSCTPGTAVGFVVTESEPRGVCHVAQAAAHLGLAGSLATLGGSVAVTFAERGHGDRVGSGVLAFGTLGLVPLVAVGSLVTRRRCEVEGVAAARALGWVGYASALATSMAAWWLALEDRPADRGLTIGIGALGAFAALPAAFDAYVAYRHSRGVGLELVLGPVTSVRARF